MISEGARGDQFGLLAPHEIDVRRSPAALLTDGSERGAPYGVSYRFACGAVRLYREAWEIDKTIPCLEDLVYAYIATDISDLTVFVDTKYVADDLYWGSGHRVGVIEQLAEEYDAVVRPDIRNRLTLVFDHNSLTYLEAPLDEVAKNEAQLKIFHFEGEGR